MQRATHRKTEKERKLAVRRGGGREPNQTTARKPGPPSSRQKSRGNEKLTYHIVYVFVFDLYTASQDGDDEAALEDFKAAAGLGSGYAKSMLVEMNPYAAMCNAMLR
jgi:hypothetical protein